MVSTIPYYSFKGLKLRHRQPFWLLIAGIIVIQLTIAAPQIMLFSLFSLYTISGPARLLFRRQSAELPVTISSKSGEEPSAAAPHGLDSGEKSRL
jgi:CDP-diacylglycerol--serine O-phosphatidyltransferase